MFSTSAHFFINEIKRGVATTFLLRSCREEGYKKGNGQGYSHRANIIFDPLPSISLRGIQRLKLATILDKDFLGCLSAS
jgi:hypothetical protein